MVLLSERLTKLDSTVVVRAVCVPSSGGAGNGTQKRVNGTGNHAELALGPKPCSASYWSGRAAQFW